LLMDLRLVCAFLLLEQKPAAAAAAALCWIYWDVLLFCEHCCNHSRCGVLSLSLSLSLTLRRWFWQRRSCIVVLFEIDAVLSFAGKGSDEILLLLCNSMLLLWMSWFALDVLLSRSSSLVSWKMYTTVLLYCSNVGDVRGGSGWKRGEAFDVERDPVPYKKQVSEILVFFARLPL
jgi:hypothetical protein